MRQLMRSSAAPIKSLTTVYYNLFHWWRPRDCRQKWRLRSCCQRCGIRSFYMKRFSERRVFMKRFYESGHNKPFLIHFHLAAFTTSTPRSMSNNITMLDAMLMINLDSHLLRTRLWDKSLRTPLGRSHISPSARFISSTPIVDYCRNSVFNFTSRFPIAPQHFSYLHSWLIYISKRHL